MAQINLTKIFKKNSFWLSVLLHLLFLLSCLHLFEQQAKIQEKPDLYVPAYLYHDTPAPAQVLQPVLQQPRPEPVPTSVNGIQPPKPISSPVTKNTSPLQKTTLSKKSSNDPDAIHLIGNQKTLPQPLIKLLAKALTGSLVYPKSAVDFGLRGTAYVRFLVYPDGHITNVQLVKSSSAGVLDQAAVDAVLAISPLNHVGQYLSQPKYIVFGFIFG